MVFELSCGSVDVGGDIVELWSWTLKGKESDVCRSAMTFPSERDARSDIASAKTSMKGAKFAKVTLSEIPNAGECD